MMALERAEPTVGHRQDDAPPTVALPEGVLISRPDKTVTR